MIFVISLFPFFSVRQTGRESLSNMDINLDSVEVCVIVSIFDDDDPEILP